MNPSRMTFRLCCVTDRVFLRRGDLATFCEVLPKSADHVSNTGVGCGAGVCLLRFSGTKETDGSSMLRNGPPRSEISNHLWKQTIIELNQTVPAKLIIRHAGKGKKRRLRICRRPAKNRLLASTLRWLNARAGDALHRKQA
jgi:hypothetical protein